MTDKYFIEESKDGNVKIADDVIKIADDVINRIAEETAYRVEGVVDNSNVKIDGMKDILNVKNFTKQTKVTTDELEGNIDLYITLEYGYNIIDVASEIQDRVKEAVENMTDLEVSKVNVHVTGITFDEREAKQGHL